MKRFKGQTGMSLVEATIILLVLMLLTGVIAPSITDFVNDAKRVKVKEDCEAIGITIARITRDVGNCLMMYGEQMPAGEGCTRRNRVDLLVSDGVDVLGSDLTSTAVTYDAPGGTTERNQYNWDTIGNRDTMVHQFVENAPRYPTPDNLRTVGSPTGGVYHYSKPWFNYGWRGAYLQSPVSWDPWGKPYLVNTLFLSVARDAQDGVREGERSGGWSRTVFCLSAGSNKLYETPFEGNTAGTGRGVVREGDDYFYPISGNTH
jgi:type II secretory pathway pseudopilin PulG